MSLFLLPFLVGACSPDAQPGGETELQGTDGQETTDTPNSCPLAALGCRPGFVSVDFHEDKPVDLQECLLLRAPAYPNDSGGFGQQDFVFEVAGKERVVFTRATTGGAFVPVTGVSYSLLYQPDWKYERVGLVTREGALKYWVVQEPPEVQGDGYVRNVLDVVPSVAVKWSGFDDGNAWESDYFGDCPIRTGGILSIRVGADTHLLKEREYVVTDEYIITVINARQTEPAGCVGIQPNISYEVLMRKW